MLVLEEATLCVGCGLNCVIHQKEKDRQRPGRPSTLYVELVLQAIVLVLSSETATHFCYGRDRRRVAHSPRKEGLGTRVLLS